MTQLEHTSEPEFALRRLAQRLVREYPAKTAIDYVWLLGLGDGMMTVDQLSEGKRLIGFVQTLADLHLAVGDSYDSSLGRIYWNLRLSSQGYWILNQAVSDASVSMARFSSLFVNLSIEK